MNEHDDDLESEVQQGADEETESYPETADQLGDNARGSSDEEDADLNLDEDEAEL